MFCDCFLLDILFFRLLFECLLGLSCFRLEVSVREQYHYSETLYF